MVYRSLEILHAGHMRYLRLAASSNRSNYALKSSIGGVIDDPSAVFVFKYPVDLGVELRLCVQAIALPELPDLADDLLAVWISTLPLHRRVESKHERVDLEARGVVDSLS